MSIYSLNTRHVNKPKYLRRGAVQGAAFEIPVGSLKLRDINGRVSRMGAHAAPNTEPVIRVRRGLSTYYFDGSATTRPEFKQETGEGIPATGNSGTFWIALFNYDVSNANRELITALSGSSKLYLFINNGVISYGWNGTTTISTGVSVSLNEFLVLSIEWDINGIRVYKNGRLITNNLTAPASSGAIDNFSIGTWSGGDIASLRGHMDMISARVLPKPLGRAMQLLWANDIWYPYRSAAQRSYIAIISGGLDLVRVINEVNQLSEQRDSSRTLNTVRSEVNQISEQTSVARNIINIATDTMQLITQSLFNRALSRNINETAQLAEQSNFARTLSQSISETSQIAESTVNSLAALIIQVVNETSQITETAVNSLAALIIQVVNEACQVSETIQQSVAALIIQVINETTQWIESTALSREITAIRNETQSVSESSAITRALAVIINESLSVIEFLYSSAIILVNYRIKAALKMVPALATKVKAVPALISKIKLNLKG